MKVNQKTWFDSIEDTVEFYTHIFPSAIPLVYNHEMEHPLESRFQELYGDTFFLIYKPMGKFGFIEKKSDIPFRLILIRNAYTFEKYANFFFEGRRESDSLFRANKVKCFGNVKLLMMNEDKEQLYSQYRNAVSLAFKDGNNPVADKRIVSYLYNNHALVETPSFLVWDKNIDKEFEYGHEWHDEDEK